MLAREREMVRMERGGEAQGRQGLSVGGMLVCENHARRRGDTQAQARPKLKLTSCPSPSVGNRWV